MHRSFVLLATLLLPLLGACVSSFGSGGGDAPPQKVIVVPQGTVLCPNGTVPPCS